MVTLLSFLSLLFFPIFFSLIYTKKIKNSKQNLPPSPPKLPFIGNLHQLQGLLHRRLHDLSKQHGPVMLLHLGFVPVLVVSSSEAAEEVLKTHDLECCTRPKALGMQTFSRNGKDIGFAPYGEEWRELRKLAVLKFFNAKKVQSFRYIREEENDLMVKKLTESALKQSPVDLSKTLFSLTASIVFRSAFGHNYFESKQINKEKIEQLMFEALANMTFKFSDFFPVAGIGWFVDFVLGEHKRLSKAFLEVDTFVRKVADDHRHGVVTTPDRPDIVDVMLDMIEKQKQDESFKLTTDHLHGVISNLFLAGVDTSAITMIWAMAELVRNPRVMKKVQDEIRTRIRERLSEEDLDKVQYLKLVVKETLRLHPAAPLLLPKETMSPIKIQGYDIPPKTLLIVNAWAIGQDPKHWENPEEFIPERFMDCPVDYKGHSFEMLPFGSGRRMCPGMAFGIATVELGLLHLLYFFDWKLPEESKGIDMEESGDVTVVKKTPLELLPILRR
ncbi:Cytochrome P450 71B4 [Raphanus sativus]|uniref:Cytochrome P450 71B4-like n=1 Tax=Raphanus sativus TaxID=3726 RepID=A0A6J0L581_RAPSA|nr:cytochrome P450 71B4-like [Raphanus sativus]KAJ4877921.1 Cytochrome P450 71B4 [Raphanus sativus]